MQTLTTTRMSSKGQVVIPEEVRKRMGLKEGDRFVVVGKEDVVILKSIPQPSMDQFDDLIDEARNAAKTSGLQPSDISKAVAKVRKRR